MAVERKYISSDPESQEAQAEYHKLLGEIERRNDPSSNTVLVVDDSRMVLKMVSRGIRERDDTIVVYEAQDGQQALERLAEMREKHDRDPLFIVTDLEMPVMDGWEFIEALRREYESQGKAQGIPVIVLSSSSGEKGGLLFKKSVHGKKARYSPMVTVAKENCVKPDKYTAVGDKGMSAWAKHFLRSAGPSAY